MKKIISLFLSVILVLAILPAASAAADDAALGGLEVVSVEEIPDAPQARRTYGRITFDASFLSSKWEEGEAVYLPFLMTASDSSYDKYYVNIYNSNKTKVASANGYFRTYGIAYNLTISWTDAADYSAGTYYLECYGTFNNSLKGNLYPFYIVDNDNPGDVPTYTGSHVVTDATEVDTTDAVANNFSTPNSAWENVEVDAPDGTSDYTICMKELYAGSSAATLVKDENTFNISAPSGMQWLLMGFELTNRGTSDLVADDIFNHFLMWTTSYGTTPTLMSTAAFSGDREDMGIYDVTVAPGESSMVWMAILTKTNQGLPYLTLDTADGKTYLNTHPDYEYNFNEWVEEDGKMYYVDETGSYVTGWKQIDEEWYYFDDDNAMVTGWKKVNGSWYYFSAEEENAGVMVTGWQTIDGDWYHFSTDGVMSSGWKSLGGIWYYFDANGVMASGWEQINGIWYYFNETGIMQTGWQEIDGVWYYFKSSGAMATGWQSLGGIWYYFKGDGTLATGWANVGGTWYYFNNSGIMQTGWQEINGVWYYFKSSGAMATGWQSLGGIWYYFKGDGAMATGWTSVGGTWYFFNNSGIMQTGWQEISGVWYYFHSSGAMATGTVTLGGVQYVFSASGALQS